MARQRDRLEPAARTLERRPPVPVLGVAYALVALLRRCIGSYSRYPRLLSRRRPCRTGTAISPAGHARRPDARALGAGYRAVVARSRAPDFGIPRCDRLA